MHENNSQQRAQKQKASWRNKKQTIKYTFDIITFLWEDINQSMIDKNNIWMCSKHQQPKYPRSQEQLTCIIENNYVPIRSKQQQHKRSGQNQLKFSHTNPTHVFICMVPHKPPPQQHRMQHNSAFLPKNWWFHSLKHQYQVSIFHLPSKNINTTPAWITHQVYNTYGALEQPWYHTNHLHNTECNTAQLFAAQHMIVYDVKSGW